MLTSCEKKRQGISNQAFTMEKSSHIKCIGPCNVKASSQTTIEMLKKVNESNEGTK